VAEGLREILGSLNSARPLEDILDLILEQAEEFLGAEAGALYRLDPVGDMLDVAAARGLAEATCGRIDVGEGVVGWAVMARRPVVVSGVGASGGSQTRQPSAARAPAGRGRIGRAGAAGRAQPGARLDRSQWDELPDWAMGRFRSLMAVPLVGKDRVYGVIALCFSESRGFSHEELKLAMSFGDQAALAIENAELRAKAEESAAAAERSRLARDLHDAVTQTLFSASLIAEVLPRLWKQSEDEGLKRLDELRRLTRGALAEMRSLLLELRPATLMEVGLEDLLRQLAEAMTGRAGIPVYVELGGASCGGVCALPPQARVGLYRIAQESLSNVVRHSGASEAWVSLTCSGNQSEAIHVELRVRDNGRGFDQDVVSPEHLGLRIMQERAAAIGARISVESRIGRGTEIVVAWNGLRGGEGS
jgi:signal transduction histidine kinase